MFTGNTTSLRSYDGQFGLSIVRDCNFAYVGKVPTQISPRIVPCQSSKNIQDALSLEGISGIITKTHLVDMVPQTIGAAIADDPVLAGNLLHEYLADLPEFQWSTFATQIPECCIIHPTAFVASNNVSIGRGVVIDPGAIILERTVIGDFCRIGPGVVVGTDAFEVDARRQPVRVLKQSGGVRLGLNVEIQAKCTLVRATFGGFTEIGCDTKIDCQVHVAHDCYIGQGVRIAACAELSGRVWVGDEVFMGPNCSVSNGVRIGSRAKITIGSVVTRDVEPDVTVSGNFAVSHERWLDFVRSVR